MLVLAPKKDEVIVIEIPDEDPNKEPRKIEICLLYEKDRLRVGIEAGREIPIYRKKVPIRST